MTPVDSQSQVAQLVLFIFICCCHTANCSLYQFKLVHALTTTPEFAHGEGVYWDPRYTTTSSMLMEHIDDLRVVALKTFNVYERLSTACARDTSLETAPLTLSPANCQSTAEESFKVLLVLLRYITQKVRHILGPDGPCSDQLEKPSSECKFWMGFAALGICNCSAILAHHWGAALQCVNTTRMQMPRVGVEFRSVGLHIATWRSLAEQLGRRMEMMRWHLSYHMLFRIFEATGQGKCLPEMAFHEFCCTSAEILYQIARYKGILERRRARQLSTVASGAVLPFDAGFVEVGVETGETSRQLLELLPANVRLTGVDPFTYSGADKNNLTWQEAVFLRKCNASNPRCSSEFMSLSAKLVEEMYGAVYPPGRANLLRIASPSAAEDPLFSQACFDVDFVFLDGDHSYEAVKADISAWLKLLRKRPCDARYTSPGWQFKDNRSRHRVLAGHDFSFMFPGVIDASSGLVDSLARDENGAVDFRLRGEDCQLYGKHRLGTIQLSSNSIWWTTIAS